MNRGLQIGNIRVWPPVFSAPMAGYTNFAYRELIRRLGGAGLIFTEMVSARAFAYMDERGEGEPERLWGVQNEAQPLAVQIWDNQASVLEELASHLVREFHVSVIDLNFGCPAPAIAKRSESGSYLLREPDKVGALVERVARVCAPTPVTAKIRLGLTEDTINAVDVARAVEDAGGAALTVHGRTARQMYTGKADWDEIAKVKSSLRSIPLIGNGDIKTAREAVERLKNYPVDAVMIGRGALERPWIFRQIVEILEGKEPCYELSSSEQRDVLLLHFRLTIQRFGPELGVTLMRRYAARYSRGRQGGRIFRDKISRVTSESEFLSVVEKDFIVEDEMESLD